MNKLLYILLLYIFSNFNFNDYLKLAYLLVLAVESDET